VDKQKLEALRQLEVGKAIERLMEEDRLNRQALGEKLQQRMTEAEIRKRRREQDNYRVNTSCDHLYELRHWLKSILYTRMPATFLFQNSYFTQRD